MKDTFEVTTMYKMVIWKCLYFYIFLGIILFLKDPDLLDAIIEVLMSFAEYLSPGGKAS